MIHRILIVVCIGVWSVLLQSRGAFAADPPKTDDRPTFWVIPHTHWEGAVFKTREEYLEMGLPNILKALRLRWSDVGTEAIHFDGNKTHRPRWTPLLGPLASDLREWRLASGRPDRSAPVIPAHDGEPWQADDWRNWRRRAWRRVAPDGTRPRDLRSSYITMQIYAGRPLTEIARHAGASVAMIDRHYAGVIANWDGNAVPAERQIQLARQSGGRPVDVGGPGSGRSGS